MSRLLSKIHRLIVAIILLAFNYFVIIFSGIGVFVLFLHFLTIAPTLPPPPRTPPSTELDQQECSICLCLLTQEPHDEDIPAFTQRRLNDATPSTSTSPFASTPPNRSLWLLPWLSSWTPRSWTQPPLMTTRCAHTFHLDCLSTWLAAHPTCPSCHTRLGSSSSPLRDPTAAAAAAALPGSTIDYYNIIGVHVSNDWHVLVPLPGWVYGSRVFAPLVWVLEMGIMMGAVLVCAGLVLMVSPVVMVGVLVSGGWAWVWERVGRCAGRAGRAVGWVVDW
ncbi:hypothetical protein K491DRAFT_733801 [Lophiostoma macrostomum CBS 122681]|uniref:RING-type domain-containing protein n=1 Tax=Lophiostoma macrostomum CBS 122681 TaxID=1314788 RepID=A0A6A6TSN3_9PLEO|nr:hypothetical protein K491DRAFT_733801 [Lophiostoma macrostomum CBS 122681]